MTNSLSDFTYSVYLKHRFKKQYCSEFDDFGCVAKTTNDIDKACMLELGSNALFKMQDAFMFSRWKVVVTRQSLTR
ncbi:hypothetical protein A5882_003564 [Enterococcus sp. 4E1_DIV0656]|uniref:hypothetical protein n=1 Tax=Enterococcus sp. 4E1_DIV0656 TaxID=1834180 RepID=UPI000A3A991F|nr:hypothetical protein [Enterococcus sp. 4E1_DIV0656]OTO09231.1 hypothetical protein A5882_003564 [Enterococcus sp. 4E1_DIV0656]